MVRFFETTRPRDACFCSRLSFIRNVQLFDILRPPARPYATDFAPLVIGTDREEYPKNSRRDVSPGLNASPALTHVVHAVESIRHDNDVSENHVMRHRMFYMTIYTRAQQSRVRTTVFIDHTQ